MIVIVINGIIKMKFTELDDLFELLDYNASQGLVTFARRRAVIFDNVSFGLLRRELIQTLGLDGARRTLTRFGHAFGRSLAQNLRHALPWDTRRDWQLSGARLVGLLGLTRVEVVPDKPDDPNPPFAASWWHECYEAEQHLLHIGQHNAPVCWTLQGIVSGFLSYAFGKEIYCVERSCAGAGAESCLCEVRTAEGWGAEYADALSYFQPRSVETAMAAATRGLARLEPSSDRRREDLESWTMRETAGMVVRSQALKRVLRIARRFASTDSSVLISGESGVGKERVARLIYESSQRASGPFVAVNCGALTPTLLESELFGHAQGAFTGAQRSRRGLFETAAGGTIFLDEIGELEPSMQVSLLRVLQERSVRRVGESAEVPVDVRVIAATNRELATEVKEGRFREDLFYRLRVVELRIPPLRERRPDILPLARRFVEMLAERMGRPSPRLSRLFADALLAHSWPGNVRELANAIEHALVVGKPTLLEPADLPEEVRGVRSTTPLAVTENMTLREVEAMHIRAVLAQHGDNKQRAATALGIGVATLYRKLKRMNVSA